MDKQGTVLALDLALRTGWAYGSPLGPERWGAFDVSKEIGLGPRLVAFEMKLRTLIDLMPDEIWIEMVLGNSYAASTISRSLQAVVCLDATKRRIPVRAVQPGRLKKAATGKGNAAKIPMLEIAVGYLERSGYHVQAFELERTALANEVFDESDALVILAFALGHL